MSWFNIGDEAHRDNRHRESGLDGFGLFAAAGSYTMDELTDGFVPEWFVKSWPGGPRAATKLVNAGLWARATRDGQKGYQYVEVKKAHTRAYIERQRAKWRKDKRGSSSGEPQ